jgi:hypothetical protein
VPEPAEGEGEDGAAHEGAETADATATPTGASA